MALQLWPIALFVVVVLAIGVKRIARHWINAVPPSCSDSIHQSDSLQPSP